MMMMTLITSHLSWCLREKLDKEDHTADQADPDQARRPWWRRLMYFCSTINRYR
jgi:hypothetical protein